MTVPVYSSHTSALSLWQSALHQVLSKQSAQQESTHRGIGVTALAPEMMATAQVLKQFDHTGSFTLPDAVGGGGTGQAVGSPPAPTTVKMQCAQLYAQLAYYSVTDPSKL